MRPYHTVHVHHLSYDRHREEGGGTCVTHFTGSSDLISPADNLDKQGADNWRQDESCVCSAEIEESAELSAD